jgi:uncharacterized protein (TIRG00374 family)
MDFNTAAFYLYFISLAFLLTIVTVVLSGMRYRLMLRKMGTGSSALKASLAIFAGQTASFVVPFKMGSVTVRPLMTKRLEKASVKTSLFATVFENMFDLGWQVVALPFLLIMVGEYALLHNIYIEIAALTAFLAASLLAARRYDAVLPRIWDMKRLVPKSVRSFMMKRDVSKKSMTSFMRDSAGLMKDRAFFAEFLLWTAAIIIVTPLVFWMLGIMLHMPMGFREAFLVFWISGIIGRLSGIPGGYVTRDVSSIAIMGLLGFDLASATALAIIHRIVIIGSIAAVGGPAITYAGGGLLLRKR